MNTPATGREFKNRIYEEFARVGKAISSPRRLELIDLLCQGPRTVEELGRQAGQSIANTSQHLQVLRAANLVEAQQNGHFVTYKIADEKVSELFRNLRELAEDRISDIERARQIYLEDRGVADSVPTDEMKKLVAAGEAVLLDVRPSEEYAAGHIPGAVSLPYEELGRRLNELPRDKEIITYCRGPYCAAAIEAVRMLRLQGFRASRMEEGVIEWRSRGGKLEAVD